MFRPRLPKLAASLRRRLHNISRIAHAEDGIPGLYTPQGIHIAWTEYQGLMIDKLNALTAGSPGDNSMPVKSLLIKYARQPNMASLFNHASMAHNNHFYFSCLAAENTEDYMPTSLRRGLESSFSSLDSLRREFVATGSSMFGPGFVWLVRLPTENKYSILTTYIAGSPYAAAHYRRQPLDMNTEASPTNPADFARVRALQNARPVNSVGAFGPLSESAKVAPGGINVIPVLCVNTWQHAYIVDWGLRQKKQFIEAWWNRIDWKAVADNSELKDTTFIS